MTDDRIETLIIHLVCNNSHKGNRHYTKEDIKWICSEAKKIFLAEPSLLELEGSFVVVGDLHGSLKALNRILIWKGLPPQKRYIFLGDYVDRGEKGIEVMLLLLSLKMKYPEHIFLLRGNHEGYEMGIIGEFRSECARKWDKEVLPMFLSLFKTIPIAAVINHKHFCVHGGLSQELHTLDDIRRITRPVEIPKSGLLAELVWSDPSRLVEEWGPNPRGNTITWGEKIARQFLQTNNLTTIIRGHQTPMEGFEYPFEPIRHTITVFSVPKYLYEEETYLQNKGAVVSLESDEPVCEIIPKQKTKLKAKEILTPKTCH